MFWKGENILGIGAGLKRGGVVKVFECENVTQDDWGLLFPNGWGVGFDRLICDCVNVCLGVENGLYCDIVVGACSHWTVFHFFDC